jgi:hypothetical protein
MEDTMISDRTAARLLELVQQRLAANPEWPKTQYLGLANDVEADYPGYERQEFNIDTPKIQFDPLPFGVMVTQCQSWDAKTGGNMLTYFALTSAAGYSDTVLIRNDVLRSIITGSFLR